MIVFLQAVEQDVLTQLALKVKTLTFVGVPMVTPLLLETK